MHHSTPGDSPSHAVEMKFVLISDSQKRSLSFTMNRWAAGLLSLMLIAVPVSFTAAVFLVEDGLVGGNSDSGNRNFTREQMLAELSLQRQEVEQAKEQARLELSALTVKIGEIQSKVVRLDALGERLTEIADLDEGEFDFTAVPAQGGPEIAVQASVQTAAMLDDSINDILARLTDREQQLETLEALITNNELNKNRRLAGRPILRGWMSSPYGMRNDPFSGKPAFHGGMDFAGKEGSDVVAVASGVVTWASNRYGYGNLVEIHHSDGTRTRYGHLKDIHVQVGDVVKKGKTLASMGSTGRSTGPHVHFEVFKNGRTVDPATYINQSHQ